MADLYHDQSQFLLADYLSVRGSVCLRPVGHNYNLAQPAGIAGKQGNEPVPDGGVSVLSRMPIVD
jgi:hypothetical protein